MASHIRTIDAAVIDAVAIGIKATDAAVTNIEATDIRATALMWLSRPLIRAVIVITSSDIKATYAAPAAAVIDVEATYARVRALPT